MSDSSSVDRGEYHQESTWDPIVIDMDDGDDDDLPGKKRKVNPLPRIVKSDIRRFYPTMIENVFNSNDFRYFTSFFKSFALPSMTVAAQPFSPGSCLLVPTSQNSENNKIVVRNGYSWMRFQFFKQALLHADNIFRVLHTSIVRRPHAKESAVVLLVDVHVSRIYDINAAEFEEFISSPRRVPIISQLSEDSDESSSEESAVDAPWSSACDEVDPVPTVVEAFQQIVGIHSLPPLLPKPQACTFQVRMIFQLAENRAIQSVKLEHGLGLNVGSDVGTRPILPPDSRHRRKRRQPPETTLGGP